MRVVLCCAALGGGIGICLAFVAEHISDHYEHVLIQQEMAAEMDAQIAQHGNDSDAQLPRSAWKSVYIDRIGRPPTSPPALRSLSPGLHELDDRDSDRFAAVRIAPIGRVTIVAGLPDSPERDRRFSEELLAMILLGAALGAWLGRMLAGNMLEPVLRLSHEVDSAEPGAELQRIEADHRSDEVGALALALIRYRERMQLAIEREILFSADASHELRTPLCVLQGALDLMRESQGAAASGQRRIERMRRSAAEIGTLLDALLLIARSSEAQETASAAIEFGPALASAIAEFREELAAAQIAIGLRCATSARIQAPPDLLRVALRLLFRSIANGAFGNRLLLHADAHGLVLASATTDTQPADPQATATADTHPQAGPEPADARQVRLEEDRSGQRRSDETGSVGMLRRLCERYGWSLELAQAARMPTLLTLRMDPPAAD